MKNVTENLKRKWYMLPWLVAGTSVLIRGSITRLQYGVCLVALLYFLWKDKDLEKMSNFGNDTRKGRYNG